MDNLLNSNVNQESITKTSMKMTKIELFMNVLLAVIILLLAVYLDTFESS